LERKGRIGRKACKESSNIADLLIVIYLLIKF